MIYVDAHIHQSLCEASIYYAQKCYAEEKMLWEGIELLESTYVFGKPYYRPDNTITRGLNTIGYSLLNGWNDPEMDEE